MADWIKEALKLRGDHTWRARPGCRIFVADRGMLRLDFPQDWVMIPGEKSFNFHDHQPPDDDIHMEISIMRLPPIDWSGLPLRDLIPTAIQGDERDIQWRGEIQEQRNGDMEIAWLESMFIDRQETEREARTRFCLARGHNIQTIITMEYWIEDAAAATRAWDDALGSLELGMAVEDPTKGHVLH